MWFFRALIVLVGVIALLWLGMQNAGQTVDFKFFAKEYVGLDLNLLILLVFVTGMVFSFFIAAISEFALRRKLGRYRRELGRMEREIAALRSLPLEETDSMRESN